MDWFFYMYLGLLSPAAASALENKITAIQVEQVSAVTGEAVSVRSYQQLQEALAGSAEVIRLAPDFSLEGETAKLLIARPVVIDGNHQNIDFGLDIRSNGVTIQNLSIYLSEFDKGVSTPGKTAGTPGDCLAVQIANTGDGLPVVLYQVKVVEDIFKNHNSAIYLSDGSHVRITDCQVRVRNQENNKNERGGIFIGHGVKGLIAENTVVAAKTALPMTPLARTDSLNQMLQNQNVYDGLVIRDNVLLGRYVVRTYLNGDLFGTDQKLLTGADKNGVREKLSAFLIALEERNDCGALYPDPAAHETPFVQARLDKIMAGGSYYENNVFFHITQDGLVAEPAPQQDASL